MRTVYIVSPREMWNNFKSRGVKIPYLLVLLVADGLSQTPPTAQTPPTPINPVVVTVSAEAIPLSASSASVTVLTKEFIENSHAENVSDVLRQVPFLYLSQTGGHTGLSTVTLRGGDPNFTLVMIDGIPVNDITNILGGSFDFSTLSTDNIEQIEIVRGPMSALYGSEGIGGVINIITQSGEDMPHFSLNGMFGNFSSGQAGFRTSAKKNWINYSLAGSYFNIDKQTENNELSLGTLSFKSVVPLRQNNLLRLTTRYHDSHAEGFPENSGGPEFALIREPKVVNAEQLTLGLNYQQQLIPWWRYNLNFDLFSRQQESRTPSILDTLPPSFRAIPSVNSRSTFRRLRLGFLNRLKINSELSVNLGVRARNEDGEDNSLIANQFPSFFDLERQTVATTGEIIYRSSRLTFSLGSRLDKTKGFDVAFSPRVGVVLSLDARSRLRTSWGEGFKLPSFFALGEPNVGNSELQPEQSRSFDIGFEHTLNAPRLQLSFTFFHNSFKNLIDFSPQLFQLVNRSQAKTQGLEFGIDLPFMEQGKLGGHLQFLDWEVQGTSEPLRDRPRWRGGTHMEWNFNQHARLRWETLWVGSRFDFQIPTPYQETVGGYSTSNIVFSYQLPYGLTAYGRANNLLNQHYHEFIGFPNPGIYARVGLRYQILGH